MNQIRINGLTTRHIAKAILNELSEIGYEWLLGHATSDTNVENIVSSKNQNLTLNDLHPGKMRYNEDHSHPTNFSYTLPQDWEAAVNKAKEVLIPTYKFGQFFQTERGDTLLLVRPSSSKACLINIENGNRVVEPIEIGDSKAISQKELLQMTDGTWFKLWTNTLGRPVPFTWEEAYHRG